LGDRIRMNDLSADPGVFIRSMATRGALGGLASAAADAIDLLGASGRESVIVETVGVGQDEVDVARVAHSTVVVSVPGLGDEIQAMKAGIIEIADIHVVNKADREGADRTVAELRNLLAMAAPSEPGWELPILPCVATRGAGISELADQIEAHRSYLSSTGKMEDRLRAIARNRVLRIAHTMVSRHLEDSDEKSASLLDREIQRVVCRQISPYQCAQTILEKAAHSNANLKKVSNNV